MKKKLRLVVVFILFGVASGCAASSNHVVSKKSAPNLGTESTPSFNGLVCLHVMISPSLKSLSESKAPSWLVTTDERRLASAAERAITEEIRNDGASVRDHEGRLRFRYIDEIASQSGCNEKSDNIVVMIRLDLNKKNQPYFLFVELQNTSFVLKVERVRDVPGELSRYKESLYFGSAQPSQPTPVVVNPIAWNSINDTYELVREIAKSINWGDAK